MQKFKKIKSISLKKWDEPQLKDEQVEEKLKQEELKVLLSNKVYTCFLYTPDKSTQSLKVTISQYKNKFNSILKEIGLKNLLCIQ